ncbi:sodium:solute symporter family protein [Allosaccharopolyspora coralli]|uniref:Sodium:solute symporter family protein n=1 Tax=Allosaccharopolyspora coralli TaxID=2665642 RepID=A0A5Q3Q7B2_9PSEU|nr:sodium:solute symporter family protein [Allosaccharopolyspora coralli]QGK70551.1 sodium:solute symporter family protein [Allosaccharopolyspora coralli]
MNNLSFGGASGIMVLVAYAVMMLVIGYFAGRKQPNVRQSVRSYYLAGQGLGFVALFFTLYATQYSGNSVVGYAPEAYRSGFVWWQSVPFMTAAIAAYLLFAPRLYVIAKRESFVTPTDWVRYRFRSTPVNLLVAALMLWGLSNYLLEQLVAMGQGISGLTGDTVPYQIGVVAFVLVMLVYSWMGGMRAVALTDVMQGIALLVGVVVLLAGALYLAGGDLGDVTRYLIANEPDKVQVPVTTDSVDWLSMIIMIGLGAAVYPHAIQRIYAARDERTLKRSLAIMAWMPLVTTGVVFLVGIIGLRLFPGLSTDASEQLVGVIANEVAGINLFFYATMILLFGGVIAAIVSTADSALLSFSSIVSRDLYARHISPRASEARQVLVGKIAGVVAIAILLVVAWNPPATLYNIFVLKFELIVQLAPVFMLGLYWNRLSAAPVFWGMLAGALVAGGMTVAGVDDLYGVPGGLVGLALNVVICVVGSLLAPDSTRTPEPPRTRRAETEVSSAAS